MRLWLFSSGDGFENEPMDEDLVSEIENSRPTFTFVPAHSDDADEYYDEFIDRFSAYEYANFRMLDLENGYSKKELKRALKSQMIYLSGGNTFQFLRNLRSTGFIDEIRHYVRSGGVLGGHSAGAILMTPHIRTAAIPDFDRDENEVGIRNIFAAKFVKFEFFPHYLDQERYSSALSEASLSSQCPIYAAADGGGINATEKGLRFYGHVWVFYKGMKLKVNTPLSTSPSQ